MGIAIPSGGAGSSVAATAGISPSALAALWAGGSPFAGLGNQNMNGLNALGLLPPTSPGQELGPFLQGITQPSGVLVPAGQAPPGGGSSTPGLAPAAAGGAAPSLADVLNAIVGPAPSAPTAAEFGAAPTLSDFFNAAPYQQAQNQLQAGDKQAQGTIGSAYNQAVQQLAQINAQANASTGQALGQARADSQGAVNNVNALAQQAGAQAGAGGQVQGRIAAVQGVLGGQNAAQNALDNQLASVQKSAQADNSSNLTSSKQNALNFLASQVSGQGNKISLAEAQDQARAQQMLAAANNTRNVDMARANATYGSQQKSYQAAIDRLMGGASKAVGAQNPGGGKSWAQGQQQQWIQGGSSGDQNSAALATAAHNILAPVPGPQGSSSKPSSPTYQDALTRLYTNAQSFGGTNSPMFGVLANWVKNYYDVQKQGLGASGPSQSQLAQYLYNTYLGG